VYVNRLRTKLSAGEAAFGGWCAIPDSFSAEVVAASGCDYVTVDMQHGLAAFSDLVAMLQAIALHGPTSLVRIPAGDLATAQRALDAGAEGIIVPYVGSYEEARAAVAACRYPPLGHRSYGPVRSRLYLGPDSKHANEEVLCLVMIETKEGLDNLAEILDAPGVDGIYVGPADLALSIGGSRADGIHPLPAGPEQGREDTMANSSTSVDTAIAQILGACVAKGKPVGIHTRSGIDASAAVRRGFSFATVSTDAVLLAGVYAAELEAARAE
jgi:4-hydroxy-2-oxoheptanedioate aldolase